VDYAEALEALFRRRRFGVRPGLDGIRALLSALGDPQRKLLALHIAGTNGKGSTAAFAESILRAAGRRTGMYTSPHLLRFTERIRVDGREVAPTEAARLAGRALAAAPEATFFEIATAMAFVAFAEAGVEVAVVEAGLGGRLDSTNVLDAPLASVVTGVALDHTEILGPTLSHVAREKAGIFRAGVPAVVACDDEEARAVLLAEAERVGAPLELLGRDFAEVDATLGLAGRFQRRNAALAVRAVAHAAARGGFTVSDEARARGLAGARWPGRLERFDDVLLDAAHNPDGARTLAAELPALAQGRPVTLVFGTVEDKDAPAMLAALRPTVARVILTRVPSPRGRDPQSLLTDGAVVIPEVAAALAGARAHGGLALVAGSIFLVAEARRLITGEPADPIAAQDPPAQKL
jgi:dihydrofolate synthase/folylpolyglutamate synthase